MGGAQPLAATLHGGVCLAVEVDPARVERRLATRYLDRSTASLDEALRWCDAAKRAGEALSVGLIGNCAAVLPELVRRGWVPDALTDQTSAHDPLHGYIPAGLSLDEAGALRRRDPDDYLRRPPASIATHVRAMLAPRRLGGGTLHHRNNNPPPGEEAGVADPVHIPGLLPRDIPPPVCRGEGA